MIIMDVLSFTLKSPKIHALAVILRQTLIFGVLGPNF
jgi:hypothetical protein